MRKCDSCGKLYQENKDVFCPHCGAVAQKQCTHGSSFDSGRYDRGEVYKNIKPDYKNTTYNKDFEPHAQREQTPYNTFSNKEEYGDKIPKINLPDLTKTFSSGKKTPKPVGIIILVVIIAINLLSALLSTNGDMDFSSNQQVVSEQAEDISELYTVIDEAKIEMVNTEGDFKKFTLEISGMGFDDYLPENMQNDIISGAMANKMLSEDAFVEVLLCDFSKNIVNEESYNNAIEDSYYYSGEQKDDKCKYEFTYSFDYGEIVHIASGVNFYLDDGMYINAELPFSAFSLSEDGLITYYTSYADSETAWNTVFEECSNHQEIDRDVFIDFNSITTVEGE